jgi:hypothetical protein
MVDVIHANKRQPTGSLAKSSTEGFEKSEVTEKIRGSVAGTTGLEQRPVPMGDMLCYTVGPAFTLFTKFQSCFIVFRWDVSVMLART